MLAALALPIIGNDAQTLYDQVCKRLYDAPTLKVELVMNPDREYVPYSLAFEKTGKYSVRSPRQGVVADGSTIWAWFEGDDTYKTAPAPKIPQMPFIGVGLRGFYEPVDSEFKATELVDAVYLHRDAKRIKLEPAKADSQYQGLHWLVFIGEDGLPKGYEQWVTGMPSPLQRAEYRKLEVGVALDPSLFAWSPPAGFRDTTKSNGEAPPIKPAVKPAVNPTTTAANPVLGFTGTLLSGQPFRFDQLAQKNKLIVLSFWQSNAPTNKADLATLQKLHDKYAGKGLAILTSNSGSTDASLKSTYTTLSLSLPTLNAASDSRAAEAFQVKKRPTFLLVGPDGKTKSSHPTSASLLSALAKLGYKP